MKTDNGSEIRSYRWVETGQGIRLARRRVLLWLVLTLLLGGCQLFPVTEPGDDDAPPDPVPVEETGDVPEVPGHSIQQAIEFLQQGEEDSARQVLEGLLEARPGHRTAGLLMAQITEPPEDLLGTEYREYEVQPGDSLSVLAARHLGDGMMFYALARYNDIPRPGLIEAGRVLRIPRMDEPAAAPPAVVLSDESDLATTAGLLMDSGRANEAVSLLMMAGRGGQLDSRGRELLLDAGIQLSEDYLQQDRTGQADSTLDRVERHTADLPSGQKRLADQRQRIQSRALFGQAAAALDDDDLDRGHEYLQESVRLDPEFSRAAAREQEVREKRVVRQHEQALRAYRDQELDKAIAYWDKLLELNPAFEPARVYRARALELLEALEAH